MQHVCTNTLQNLFMYVNSFGDYSSESLLYSFLGYKIQVIRFCYEAPLPAIDAADGSVHSPLAASAYVVKEKIWAGRQVLNVIFLNGEFISDNRWRCGAAMLTLQNIMDWARVWNSPLVDSIPKLKMIEIQKAGSKADIRVKFSSKNLLVPEVEYRISLSTTHGYYLFQAFKLT